MKYSLVWSLLFCSLLYISPCLQGRHEGQPVEKKVVRGAMADDEEEEAVGVSVQLVLRQLPLHTVHSLAREVPINLDLKSCENLSLIILLDCEMV